MPEGTEVQLRLGERLSSATAAVGDTFEIISDEEITLADGTILPTGYSGRGEVTVAERNGMLGKSGQLGIRVIASNDAPKLSGVAELGSGSVQEKENALLAEIIARVNELFEGDLTDDDQLVYVNNVIKGKLLESRELVLQASNNTKAQFANSPTLSTEIMNAVMDALAAHETMSRQALGSQSVREGLKEVLLGPGQLYEALRDRAEQRVL
ncbi:MAG: hypothetical protein JWO83_934 [Caulobacteraceae bacterium]|nr:hypothetical protein [Caulobacteraceae bacterium]